ncbi:MAG: tetratricopeptide repeat protein [Synergistaceae bacterium]|jgi:tetratricopeptide (TPR) repeat protein|nr:tetratricopeptide repeat protein [Synergistaceae bacterium]
MRANKKATAWAALRKATAVAALSVFLLCLLASYSGTAAPSFANGDTTADDPKHASGVASADAAVKKSVRKATIRKPKKKSRKKAVSTASKAKPAESVKKPPQPTALERGIALMDEKRYEAAMPWLQIAVGQERRNPNAWYWYGRCHEAVGQLSQAQFFYTRALKEDPAFPPLSRVVTYPNDADKTPLWDPLRPARVYRVEAHKTDVTSIPPGSPESAQLYARPAPPAAPDAPRVPVYLPPAPDAAPDGSFQPPLYAPPSAPYYSPYNPTYKYEYQ